MKMVTKNLENVIFSQTRSFTPHPPKKTKNLPGFLIDGCPSHRNSFELFKTEIAPCDVCVYLKVPDATLLRRVVAKVGDADEEMAWESVKAFHNNVTPVLEELKKRDKLAEIDCEAADEPDQVFEKVLV